LFLVDSTSAIDCLERTDSKVTCYVSSGMFNPTCITFVMCVCSEWFLVQCGLVPGVHCSRHHSITVSV